MKLLLVLMLAVAMSGCASNKIIIDKDNVDMSRYEQDLQMCKQYAEEVETGTAVGSGAVGGAVVGGAVGGVTGAARGGNSANREKAQVTKNCLRNRGYKVLN